MMNRFRTAIGLAAAALTAVTGAVVAPGASAAPADTRPVKLIAQHVCTVNDNGVNYRGGPGVEYPVLGQVNRGQNLNYRGQAGDWVMGDLWGGPTGVWIYIAYLDC